MVKTKDKLKINELSLKDLLEYEKALRLIIMQYERSIRKYDGSIDSNDDEYKEFSFYNKLHGAIIKGIEEKMLELDYE